MRVFAVILAAIGLSAVSYVAGLKSGSYEPKIKEIRTVQYIHDTLPPENNPVPVSAKPDGTLSLPDSIIVRDTAIKLVFLPKEELTYTGGNDTSGRWKAVVSGVQPELKSMQLFPIVKYKTVTQTITLQSKPKRFGIGVQGGVTYTGNKIQPYIGVGISYNFITF